MTSAAVILALALAASHLSADARDPSKHGCQRTEPPPFTPHQPFVLTDPRSGLTLNLESDGRHMTAKTHDGKIVWQRDLFTDPRLEWEVGPPGIQLPGEPHVSAARQRQERRAYIAKLFITGIRAVSDCEAQQIDRTQPLFWEHYVEASSGSKYTFLLDAKTGDFMIEDVN